MRSSPDRPHRAISWLCFIVAAWSGDTSGAAPPSPDTKPAASISRGAALLARHHCGSCHAIPGVAQARSRTAASLAAYGRRSYIAGRFPNEPDTLARWIAEPAALIPDTPMPAMGVSPGDARDMAAYLGSLR